MKSIKNVTILTAAIAVVLPHVAYPQVGQADVPLQAIAEKREAKDWLEALRLINQALVAHPNNPTLYRLQALTLADHGNLYRAWQLYQAHPDWFKPAESERLQAGRLARQVIWSQVPGKDEASDLDEAKQARSDLDSYLAEPELSEDTRLRLRIDRLVLMDRQRQFPELLAEYQALIDAGHAIPAYALPSVGNAYLATKQPERAEAVYREALRQDPSNHELIIQHAYALVEGERFQEATDTLWKLREQEPAWLQQPGSRTYSQNWNRYETEDAYYMIRSYGEELAVADTAYAGMAGIGPGNSGLQESLGSVYLRRGWDNRALERFRMAETLDERDFQSRIGQVDALMNLQRYDLASGIHDTLRAQRAGNPHVENLSRRLDARRGWQAEFSYGAGRNSPEDDANTSPFGTRDGEAMLSIASPLLNDRWRVVAGQMQRWGDYADGRSTHRQTFVGARYAFGRLWSQLSVTHSPTAQAGTGFDWDNRWRFSDTWEGEFGLARHDGDVPLQASRAGIHMDSARIGVAWSPSDLGHLSTSLTRARFSDGNQRDSLQTNAWRRLLTRPHLLMDGKASVYASRNTRDDAPYFNPASDYSASVGLRINHLAWRRYERSFRQILEVDAGPYWQEGFGSAWVPAVSYRHEWTPQQRWTLGYGVHWSRPVYDGQRETRQGFDLYVRWGL